MDCRNSNVGLQESIRKSAWIRLECLIYIYSGDSEVKTCFTLQSYNVEQSRLELWWATSCVGRYSSCWDKKPHAFILVFQVFPVVPRNYQSSVLHSLSSDSQSSAYLSLILVTILDTLHMVPLLVRRRRGRPLPIGFVFGTSNSMTATALPQDRHHLGKSCRPSSNFQFRLIHIISFSPPPGAPPGSVKIFLISCLFASH